MGVLLVVPILICWALPAVVVRRSERWISFWLVVLFFTAGLSYLTIPTLIATFVPHARDCAFASCDGDMVAMLFAPYYWAAIIGG